MSAKDFNTIEDVELSTLKDYSVINYNYHPGIKASMIA